MEKELQIVAFRVGREIFGLPIFVVREIVRVPEITGVPTVPEYIEGLINLRGQIIPLVDLGKRFGVAATEASSRKRVVVVEADGRAVGLIVHSVSEVLRLDPSEIEEPQEILPGNGADYVSGVGKLNGRLVILLDLSKIIGRGAAREPRIAPEFNETAGMAKSGQKG